MDHHRSAPLLKRASASDLQAARDLVQQAQAESNRLNKVRVANPVRNNYGLKPGTVVDGNVASSASRRGRHATRQNSAVPPLLEITDDIASAVALVAEAEAHAQGPAAFSNSTKREIVARAGTFWMEQQVLLLSHMPPLKIDICC